MPDERTIEIRGGAVAFRVLAAGRGAPLVYFHSYYERSVWSPFLELLARSFSVYAPSHPVWRARPASRRSRISST